MKNATTIFMIGMIASPAFAQLRPAPDYYMETLMALSFADQYSTGCDQLVVDGVAVETIVEELAMKLVENGFSDPATAHTEMDLPPSEETDALVVDLVNKHLDAEDPNASWCAEGFDQINEETLIGSLLMEADEE